jgi:HSP20 family molecular chaperone IbpA
MTRSVSVPKGVDESMISATYKDGVLEVRVAMPEVAVMDGAHRVPIKRV